MAYSHGATPFDAQLAVGFVLFETVTLNRHVELLLLGSTAVYEMVLVEPTVIKDGKPALPDTAV
jgi:hypothetical protein